MKTRYSRLQKAWENELKNEPLQNIPDDFLLEMKTYVDQLNKAAPDTNTLAGVLTETERKYANQMLKELIEARLNKIINGELNGAPIDAQAMTPEEQKLNSDLRSLLANYRQGTVYAPKNAIEQQAPLKEPRAPTLPPSPGKKETELMLLRFLKPLPAIMGVDLKSYGPFQPGELATIPRQNAETLIKRGIAKKVEADK